MAPEVLYSRDPERGSRIPSHWRSNKIKADAYAGSLSLFIMMNRLLDLKRLSNFRGGLDQSNQLLGKPDLWHWNCTVAPRKRQEGFLDGEK